jgi:hypothetical protein
LSRRWKRLDFPFKRPMPHKITGNLRVVSE